jgi:hypothetical protein
MCSWTAALPTHATIDQIAPSPTAPKGIRLDATLAEAFVERGHARWLGRLDADRTIADAARPYGRMA